MISTELIAGIDEEITRLKQVRSLLSGSDGAGSIPPSPMTRQPKKRVLSAQARARIVAAQKKRWAAQKKAVK